MVNDNNLLQANGVHEQRGLAAIMLGLVRPYLERYM